jgi:transcription termination factor Rho
MGQEQNYITVGGGCLGRKDSMGGSGHRDKREQEGRDDSIDYMCIRLPKNKLEERKEGRNGRRGERQEGREGKREGGRKEEREEERRGKKWRERRKGGREREEGRKK